MPRMKKEEKLKVIDWDAKGNVFRFYLGTSDDYWGDDWDDVPYEHNAGTVYAKYIEHIVDIAFPYSLDLYEANYDYINSPYSKEMFKLQGIPFLNVILQSKSWGGKDMKNKYETFTFNMSKRDLFYKAINLCGGVVLKDEAYKLEDY